MKAFSLVWVFALLSILAVGGGTAVLPEMERMTVTQFHWVTHQQFRDIYSIGQVAPGPNMLMVMLIGYKMEGLLGALAVGLAFFVPDCILALFANRVWVHFAASPWRKAIQRGMAPVAIGLMLAGTYAIAKLAIFSVAGAVIAIAIFAIILWRHINPALLIALGGLAYLLTVVI
ncbi:MAG: chromate transporter [Candidatus Binataceae bacterium]